MVNKSYVVNEVPKMTALDVNMTQIDDDKSTNINQLKRFERYILQINGDMVKVKPSNNFNDNYVTNEKHWSNSSIIRWNREYFTRGARKLIDMRLALKVSALIIILVLAGFFLFPSNSQLNTNNRIQSIASNSTNNINSSAIFERDETLSRTTLPSSNRIDALEEYAKSTVDHVTNVKKYVDRINFYTTLGKHNMFTAKVSPTLPSFIRSNIPTSALPSQSHDGDCESTALPLCQGVLNYDLTSSSSRRNLTTIEYEHFQHLIVSECSKRAAQYVCQHVLEPECRPLKMTQLKPCRRICKGILESCSHIIASSQVLTEFFDCNSYPDSGDPNICEDISRTAGVCHNEEFQCGDLSCIPSKWRCDNIPDCTNGEDENECKFCNYDEFKCISNQKCILESLYCDGVEDCDDGSDEVECDDVTSSEDQEDDRIYDDSQEYEDESTSADPNHNDSDGDKIISTGDDVVPIFINPNGTHVTNNTSKSSDNLRNLKRFRSTMRNRQTTMKIQPESTTIPIPLPSKRPSPSRFIQTSHMSPCPDTELRCIDGRCITLDQICDRINDCSDMSDELHCEY